MAAQKYLKVTQVRSLIGRPERQRATVKSLGLRRIGHTVYKPNRPEIRGMIKKVLHIVRVEEVELSDKEAKDLGLKVTPKRKARSKRKVQEE